MSAEDSRARSRPWLSSLLSLLIPGLGQLRNGSLGRALVCLLLTLLIQPFAYVLVVKFRISPYLALIPGALLRLAISADAWTGAPRTPISGPRVLHVVRLLLMTGAVVVVMSEINKWQKDSVARTAFVKGNSMANTCVDGDKTYVFRAAYHLWIPWVDEYIKTSSIQRKDIIAAKEPLTGVQIVKRVIGIPGDEVVVRDHRAWVNGELLDEDYIKLETPEAEGPRIDNFRPNFGPIRVPKNRLFVLGDNRNGSTDSRVFGFVLMSDVIGQVIMRLDDGPNGDPNRDHDLMRR